MKTVQFLLNLIYKVGSEKRKIQYKEKERERERVRVEDLEIMSKKRDSLNGFV